MAHPSKSPSLFCLAVFIFLLILLSVFQLPVVAQEPVAPLDPAASFEIDLPGDPTVATATVDTAALQEEGVPDVTLETAELCPASTEACGALTSILKPRLSVASNFLFRHSATVADPYEYYGAAIAVGDFDNNGIEDVAIGVPGMPVNGLLRAGGVWVNYNRRGFSGTRYGVLWTQESDRIDGFAQKEDQFGAALAAGDFNGDGIADLAIGVPNNSYANDQDGAVHILYGTRTGLTGVGSQYYHQDVAGVGGTAGDLEHFGQVLVAGDFNGDGADDLAIGVPFDTIQGIGSAGAVNVLYGSDLGISTSGEYHVGQNSSGIGDDLELTDLFGAALASGDFDRDGFDDLIVGVPGEDIDGHSDAGLFHALYGSDNGLSGLGSTYYYMDGEYVAGSLGDGDQFGGILAVGDLDGDGFDDLVVGTPNKDWGSTDAGVVHVFFGSLNRLSGTLSRYLIGDDTLIPTDQKTGDRLGANLTVGDFNRDRRDDLVIASPGEDVSAVQDSGEVVVLYGVRGSTLATRGPNVKDFQFFSQSSGNLGDIVDEFDNFGTWAMATGDLNGDGRDDLLVGVTQEDNGTIIDAGAVHAIFSEIFRVVRLPMVTKR